MKNGLKTMCRGKDFCSELGEDYKKWSSQCFLPNQTWFGSQIDIFVAVVNIFVKRNIEKS